MATFKITRTPLYQQAYEALVELVLTGQLEPGQRVTEKSLSEMLGISSTPIREAMRKLEHDGFLESVGNSFQIISLKPADIDALYLLRKTLETLALQAAMEQVGTAAIAELERIQRMAEEAAARSDYLALVQINTEFHDQILKMAGNRWLEQTVGFVRRPLLLARLQVTLNEQHLPRILRDHGRILEAIKQGNLETAVAALHQHMENDREQMKLALIGEEREA